LACAIAIGELIERRGGSNAGMVKMAGVGSDKMAGKGPVTGSSVVFRWEGVRKHRACLDMFYDRTFSRAYSADLKGILFTLAIVRE